MADKESGRLVRLEADFRDPDGTLSTDEMRELFGLRWEEIKRLRVHEKWLKLGSECAEGFLGEPSKSHIVDSICIIGHERDELREEVKQLRASLGEYKAWQGTLKAQRQHLEAEVEQLRKEKKSRNPS